MKLKFNEIISIHSNPRSGSSWLGQIFNSSPTVRYKYQPLKSRSFHGRISDSSSVVEVYDFLNEVYDFKDEYLDQQFRRKEKAVDVFLNKNESPSHLVLKMVRYHYLIPFLLENIPEQKIIGLVRHPCGYLNSWRKAPKEFLPEWNFEEEWYFGQSYNRFRSGEYYGFHRWKEVSKLFLAMQKWFPERFHLVRYEELVENTRETVHQLFDFCDLQMEKQTSYFLKDSTEREVENDYSVFRGKKNADTWRDEFPEEITEKIYQELEGSELEIFLKP